MKRDWIRACGLAAALILMLIAPQRADAVDVSPSALSFGTIVVGDTGGPLQVTVSTYYWASIGISISGDFAQNNDCPARLPMFGSCRILVTFKPLKAGLHAGQLRIEVAGAGMPRVVVLSGTGVPGVSGRVMGAVQPVSSSSVALWAAGTSGYGKGATQLGTAISAPDGSFGIRLTCPSASAQIYLTAQGGDAGGGSNSSLMLMTALGRCGALSPATSVIINEVSTAGSVYALAQFLSKTNPGTVGAPATNATGLGNAFATVANLVDVSSGTALSTTRGGAGTAPQRNLNTIANALGACVQTNGASSAQCKELFDCALPEAVFGAGACSGGIGTVADTLAAALSIALNSARVSVDGVYNVATKAPLFSPALASVPHDWSMPLNFAPAGSDFRQPFGVAVDSSGRVWVANSNGESVISLNNDGTLKGKFAPAGSNFIFPLGVAIDSSGHVWVANRGGDTITALNKDGTLKGKFAPAGSNFNRPLGVAVDSPGHVWVANSNGKSVTALNNDGTLKGNFASAGSNFNRPLGVAVDSSGRVWVANRIGNTVTALNNDGTLKGNFAPAGSNFNHPWGVAIDSSGHVWVTNSGGHSVTELVGAAAPVKTPFIGPPQLP